MLLAECKYLCFFQMVRLFLQVMGNDMVPFLNITRCPAGAFFRAAAVPHELHSPSTASTACTAIEALYTCASWAPRRVNPRPLRNLRGSLRTFSKVYGLRTLTFKSLPTQSRHLEPKRTSETYPPISSKSFSLSLCPTSPPMLRSIKPDSLLILMGLKKNL